MTQLRPGDFAPSFTVPSSTHPAFQFEMTGGRRVVLSFLGSLRHEQTSRALAALAAKQPWFAEHRTFVFPVSADAGDRQDPSVLQRAAPYTVFWDADLVVARLYGAIASDLAPAVTTLVAGSFVLDENRRLVAFVPIGDPDHHADEVAAVIAQLRTAPERLILRQAPVLVVPNVLSRDYCRHLVDSYEVHGGVDSGYMTMRDGKTVGIVDYFHKRRKDWFIADPAIRAALLEAVVGRIVPEVKKAFNFDVTQIERFLIACYDSATDDHFRPHRDDNAEGTAHRRFAVTINLNAEDYEGGDLRFPEYGRDTYRAETGGAVVFSCSLMHEALPVTRGRRYAFLPFLFDEAAAVLLHNYLAKQNAAAAPSASS